MDTTLFDQLRRLDLPVQGYAVFGSGPLAVRGLIPRANDLDIICRDEVWAVVSRLGDVRYLPDYNVSVVELADGALTFGREWKIGDFDVDELIATAEIIDGLPFVRLDHVVRYKRIRCSEKDLQHLAALGD